MRDAREVIAVRASMWAVSVEGESACMCLRPAAKPVKEHSRMGPGQMLTKGFT